MVNTVSVCEAEAGMRMGATLGWDQPCYIEDVVMFPDIHKVRFNNIILDHDLVFYVSCHTV